MIRAAGRTTGVLVDSVSSVLSVPEDSIQPVLSTIPEEESEFLKGEVRLTDGRLIGLLDLEKIMSCDRMVFE